MKKYTNSLWALIIAAFFLLFNQYNYVSANIEYLDNSELIGDTLICQGEEVVKVIDAGKEYLTFADMTMGKILVLSDRPASDDELIKNIKSASANFCYFQKEDKMIFYNYNDDVITETNYKMQIKYVIDLDKNVLVENDTSKILMDFTKKAPGEKQQYWALRNESEKIRKIRVYILEEDGDMTFSIPELPEYILKADADLNGVTDISDLSILSLSLLGDYDLNTDQMLSFDLDCDGIVSLADLARLQQYLSKKINAF